MNTKIKVVLDEGATLPTRAHPTDAGLDLYAKERCVVWAKSWAKLDTGVHIQIPEGYVGFITSKSGLMAKQGNTSRGTIDCGYTGTIQVVLFNHSWRFIKVKKGQKISQLVIFPIVKPELDVVDNLEDTERGNGGFGSTGAF